MGIIVRRSYVSCIKERATCELPGELIAAGDWALGSKVFLSTTKKHQAPPVPLVSAM